MEDLSYDSFIGIFETGLVSYYKLFSLGLTCKKFYSYVFQNERTIQALRRSLRTIADLKGYPIDEIPGEDIISLVKDMLVRENATEASRKGHSIFVTGPGGCGKTHFLNNLCKDFKVEKGEYSCGSTGTASAVLTNGRTFHSLFSPIIRFSFGEKKDENGEYIKKMAMEKISYLERDDGQNKTWNNKWKKGATGHEKIQMLQSIKKVRIDEVSMLSKAIFLYVDTCMKRVNMNNEAFGGVQLFLSGDFCQLKPVPEEGNPDTAEFVYKCDFWKEIKIFRLNFSYRQIKDRAWAAVCEDIRRGEISRRTRELINSRRIKEITKEEEEKTTFVFCHNKDVDEHNNAMIQRNSNTSMIFTRTIEMKKTCSKASPVCQVPKGEGQEKMEDLVLKRTDLRKMVVIKLGCRVMVTKNIDVSRGIVNGTVGVVKDVTPKGTITITTQVNGKELDYPIDPVEMRITDACGCDISVKGYPLRLSYAITIHKCQGMTLWNIRACVGSDIKLDQVYTLVTRAPTAESISFSTDFSLNVIGQDREVKEFYYGKEETKKKEQEVVEPEEIPEDVFRKAFLWFLSREVGETPRKKMKAEGK